MNPNRKQPLSGMRVLICGKGGSGKSSFLTVLARVLVDRGYEVLALDGDASNPGGLARLLLGRGTEPKPLIDFFGGRSRVTCPVDDPSSLTRAGDSVSLNEHHIVEEEIPPEYREKEGALTLYQVGKIHSALEGCDGPMSKVTRDFLVKGHAVTLIDVEAGIEHFGRGIERNVDAVLVVVDPTFESFAIAERVRDLSQQMCIANVWAVLNKVESEPMASQMRNALRERRVRLLGEVHHDPDIARAGLTGERLEPCNATREVSDLIERLEIEVGKRRTLAS